MALHNVEQQTLVRELLTVLYDVKELEQFVHFNYGERLARHIPWTQDLDCVAGKTVRLFERRGLINRRLFELLCIDRPHRQSDVVAVKKVVLGSPIAPRRGAVTTVTSVRTQRSRLVRAAEIASYVFHLGSAGIACTMHFLPLENTGFLGVLCCLILGQACAYLADSKNPAIHD